MERKLLENFATSLTEFANRNPTTSFVLSTLGISGGLVLLFITREILVGALLLLVAVPILWGFLKREQL